MQKNLLSAFIILCCLLLSTLSVFAKPRDKKQQNQAGNNQLEPKLDYKDVKNVRLVFEKAMLACQSIGGYDPNALEKGKKLVDDLNKYWQVAYQLAKKYPPKRKLKKQDEAVIKERIRLINELHALQILGAYVPEANIILEEVVTVAENFFPDSVLLADAYSNLAINYILRYHKGEQALEYLVKALQITIACLGEHHLKTARIYFKLGHVSLPELPLYI